MAQLLGPDDGSRTVLLGLGQTAHGRTATVYSNSVATSLATINVYDGTDTPGAAISGSALTVDSESRIPQFWFPDGVDTLYVRVNGLATIKTVYADVDRRLDVVAGWTQAAAVADLGALTTSAAAALTSAAITGGEAPTEAEHNQVQADLAEVRTKLNAAVTDLGTMRTKVNALLASLRASNVLDT